MIPSLLERHSKCDRCRTDFQEISKSGLKTAKLISAHERLKDQYSAIPRQDLPIKAAIALLQAAVAVEDQLKSLKPLERSRAVRLAYCLFAEAKAKL